MFYIYKFTHSLSLVADEVSNRDGNKIIIFIYYENKS